MKRREILALAFAFAASMTVYALAHSRVDTYRADHVYRLHAAATPLPTGLLTALSGEFKGMVANYLILEAASFIGSAQRPTPQDWDAVARLLDQSSSLDPYFKQTYRLTQSTLPWEEDQLTPALKILERSRKHLTWDWEPGFYLGFDYYYFLKDNLAASQTLMEASKIPGAPTTLATLASRLSSRSGHTRAAIDFLASIIERTEDEKTREELGKRILALKGVEYLDAAVKHFKDRFGRMPDSLDELVDEGIVSRLPTNPYERPYTLKDGWVDF